MGAAMAGNFNIVRHLISRGANDWMMGLSGAARRNNIAMYNFFFSKLSDDEIRDNIEDVWEGSVEVGSLQGMKLVLDNYGHIPDNLQLEYYLKYDKTPQVSKDYLKSRFNL